MSVRDKLTKMLISGKEVWPIIEGGKGIGVSNGVSAGSFAAADAVGTFSGAAATLINDHGDEVPLEFTEKSRLDRHESLISYSIKAAISHAKRAQDIATGRGRVHMNLLWEMGGTQRILRGVLSGAKNLIHGITCGAGMPYSLAEVSAQYGVYYYPIISSMRAFRALWMRSYRKFSSFLLGGVVYEDPWLAGGHNGITNSEDPNNPEGPYRRLVAIRRFMREVGLDKVPLIIAGGVWHLNEWDSYITDKDVAPVAFQFGTRALLTKESPIPQSWKIRLFSLKFGDVVLNRFSPTGFYSSAIDNDFLKNLRDRSERQVQFSNTRDDVFTVPFSFGSRGKFIYIKSEHKSMVNSWVNEGYTEAMKTPDDTVVFVTKDEEISIRDAQVSCKGCLHRCNFSNWSDNDEHTTGKKPDPRSFCIYNSLNAVVRMGDINNEMVFCGSNGYRFATDPFYANYNIPSVRELVDRILTGF